MPPRVNKNAANAHDQKVNDKTFGMKNKNKSKQVQSKIAHMKMSGGGDTQDTPKTRLHTDLQCGSPPEMRQGLRINHPI